MSKLSTTRAPKNDLRDLAHQQTMDLLRLGDKSANPAIAKAAVAIAKEREKNFHASVKPAPTRSTAFLVTIVVVVTIALCWYVLLSYPKELADRLVKIFSIGGAFTVALYLLIFGHLTQENFMTAIGWLKQHVRVSGGPTADLSSHLPLGQDIAASVEPDDKKSEL